jgi:hypothetical protein
LAQPAGFPTVRDLNSVQIKLSRSECYGTCPIYSVEIAGDGRVSYHGTGYVTVQGEHHDIIPSDDVQALLEEFQKTNFFGLKETYEPWGTDLPTYTISLSVDGRSKLVIDASLRVLGPLAKLIDSYARTEQWIRGDKRTVPLLQRGGL